MHAKSETFYDSDLNYRPKSSNLANLLAWSSVKNIRVWNSGLMACRYIQKARIFCHHCFLIIWTPYNGMPRNLGFVHYGMPRKLIFFDMPVNTVYKRVKNFQPFQMVNPAKELTELFCRFDRDWIYQNMIFCYERNNNFKMPDNWSEFFTSNYCSSSSLHQTWLQINIYRLHKILFRGFKWKLTHPRLQYPRFQWFAFYQNWFRSWGHDGWLHIRANIRHPLKF